MTPRHPAVHTLAGNARHLAQTLDRHGPAAIHYARLLAERGYPTPTLGDGGSRNSDPTSSTERAALNDNPNGHLPGELGYAFPAWWQATLQLELIVHTIVAHASDIDPTPAGTGTCERCDTVVRPDHRHPERRLRAGYCPACYMGWTRQGRPDRTRYNHTLENERPG